MTLRPSQSCGIIGHRGSTRLYRAASEGEINIAKLLLDRGADPKKTFFYGETLLHAAAMSGNLEMVQLLLDIGADPNKARIDGMTPLHKAVNNEHIGTVILLLDRGADPDIKDRRGRSPRSEAHKKGIFKQIVDVMMILGQDSTFFQGILGKM